MKSEKEDSKLKTVLFDVLDFLYKAIVLYLIIYITGKFFSSEKLNEIQAYDISQHHNIQKRISEHPAEPTPPGGGDGNPSYPAVPDDGRQRGKKKSK
jgi:hypothetical protein